MMRLRTYRLDQLAKKAELEPSKTTATNIVPEKREQEHLRFWTLHKTRAMLVDLTPFRDGEFQKKAVGRWGGDFSGRPELIGQLFPILHTLLAEASLPTVDKYLHSLRSWWRLFDDIEKHAAITKLQIARVVTVSDLCEIHRQKAHDKGMQRSEFSNFLRIANFARTSENLPKLFWQEPEQAEPTRKLAPEWQIKLIRIELKHIWRDIRIRWELAEELVKLKGAENAEQSRLLRNYLRFQEAVARTKNPVPPAPDIWHTLTYDQFSSQGFRKSDMLAGFFPDANDIRVAFFLCLANTGWNPAVLLTLNASQPLVVPHPKDPLRYLLYGYKERGDTQQLSEGLYKTQGSAGVIILTLLKRTEPLRVELRKQLVVAQGELFIAEEKNLSIKCRDKLKKRVLSLEEGIRSPWLYCTSKHGISWLEHGRYMMAASANAVTNKRPRFLDIIVDNMNIRQSIEKKISYIKPGDFRDAFAEYAYRMSGGLVLFVMKQLHHKSPRTTQGYLDNTIINAEW